MNAFLISTDNTLCLLRARFNESKCARIWSAAKNSRFAFVLGFPKLGESPKNELERSARGVLMSLSLSLRVCYYKRFKAYSRALILVKTCAQKTESNISADKKRMHCEQRVR